MSKDTKYKISVMQAYEEGKKIEFRYLTVPNDDWVEFCSSSLVVPSWNWEIFDYRVKEELKYRPYKDTEEMINDFCERSGAKRSKMGEPFIWIKPYKNGKNRHLITDIYDEGVYNGATYLELEDMFRNYCYCDGSPIGKKE